MKKLILVALICAPMSLFAQKFGHVNYQEVLAAMPEMKTAQTELETLAKQYEADLQSMQDEFKKKSEAYEKEEATLVENVKQRRQQELQELYQRIQQSYQDNQAAMAKAQEEKMQPIQTKLLEAIKAVGDTGGFVYIMQAGACPYISSTLSTDVTAQIKAKLGIK